MNVLISVDKYFLDKVETMLFSLQLSVKKDTIDVYLLNHSLDDSDVLSFSQHLRLLCHKMTLHVIEIQSTALDYMPVAKGFSIETYYRLLAQFILPASLDRILWLDADIIVKKDITDFYNQSFEGKLYVACPDRNQNLPDVIECKRKLSLPETYQYFNAGVLLMNLDRLRKETDQEMIVETSYNMQDLAKYQDQDILNYLYAGQVKYNDWREYNYLLNGINRLHRKEVRRVAILHYAGFHKPWTDCQIMGIRSYWWRVRFRQGKRLEVMKAYIDRIVYLGGRALRITKN